MFTHVSDDTPQNPLMYLFFLETLAWGVAFTFFRESYTVTEAVLYTQTLATFGATAASVWGIAAIAVVVLSLVGICYRKRWLGEMVTLGGFSVWSYATFLYVIDGFLLQFFAIALPNLLFWVWWFLRVKAYNRRYL